jgi:hypothetical protein
MFIAGGAAVVCVLACPLGGATPARNTTTVTVHYNRDVRPILSDNCFHCHGPDEKDRKADLRLDTREGATAPRDGSPAIVPGHPEKSLLWKRITTTDPDDLMPPPSSHKKLTPEQKEILRAWIGAGAPYQPHWAFVTPTRPPLPEVKQRSWVRTPVDRFILAGLEARKLKPSPEAPRETLVRRVKLDLTGLPPTPEEVEAFVKDKRPDAYDRMIDRFMALPAYGEHQARYWLDAVRYGDTHGLHLDNERSHWPYRDWVVKAFNENKPFDQFTIEQIAGDLLPNPTRDQLVASGYNRCNVTTSEGGAIDEVLCALRRGPHRDHRHGVDGADSGLRRLPRPQIRPHLPKGVLPPLRLLQQCRRRRHGRQRPAAPAFVEAAHPRAGKAVGRLPCPHCRARTAHPPDRRRLELH